MRNLGVIVVMVLGSGMAFGQVPVIPVTPATPEDFETRNKGNNLTGVGIVEEKPVPKKVKVSYTAVSPVREWRNLKGVLIRGSLIAFEQGDFSQSKRELTIVREGKVRLLVEGRSNFSLVALKLLSLEDQEFVAGLVKARKETAKAAAAAAAVKEEK